MSKRASGLPAEPCATVVLDSNVVLDLWFFADARVSALRHAVEQGQLHWASTPALQDELTCILDRAKTLNFPRVGAHKELVFKAFSTWSTQYETPPAAAPHRLRCSDTDDQKFIDLALSLAPAWLLSRDKAVLKLAKRAAGSGVRIATPEQWTAAVTLAASADDRASAA